MISRTVRGPRLKGGGHVPDNDNWYCPLAPTHMYTHVQTHHLPTYMGFLSFISLRDSVLFFPPEFIPPSPLKPIYYHLLLKFLEVKLHSLAWACLRSSLNSELLPTQSAPYLSLLGAGTTGLNLHFCLNEFIHLACSKLCLF